MPRGLSGQYTLPSPDTVFPDTTIESATYNGFTADVEATFNQPTPIIAGGTGATNASQALDNLGGVELSGDTMTGALAIDMASPQLILDKKLSGQAAQIVGQLAHKTRWTLSLGDVATEGTGVNSGSDFRINAYDNAGTLIGPAMLIKRDTGGVGISSRGLGGTNPMFVLSKLTGGGGDACSIQGQVGSTPRWTLSLGDVDPEVSGDTGSNFRVSRYGNAGNGLGAALRIERSDGNFTVYNRAMNATGYWDVISDARIKTVQGPYSHGLKEIKQLHPVRYQYKNNVVDAPFGRGEHIGLVAQQAENAMPELISQKAMVIDGRLTKDCRTANYGALVFALVNAVQELAAKVEKLEAARR